MYKEFSATETLDRYLEKGDRAGVIGALTGICYLDKNFSTRKFDNGVEYVVEVKKYRELWEPLRDILPLYGDRVDQKDTTLSEKDYNDAIARLQMNFCQERIDDLKKLGRYLFPITKTEYTSPTTENAGKTNPLAMAAVAVAAAAAAILLLSRFLK